MATFATPRGWIARLSLTAAAFGSFLATGEAGAAQLVASWVDNSGGVAMTRIERRHATETTYTPLADADPGSTTFVDTSVGSGSTYCYRVFAWVDEAVSPYSEEVCAASAPDSVTVAVSKTGTGSGTVTSQPAGIDCGSACAVSAPAGTFITLTATPASGSVFNGWSGGGCTGTAPCGFATNSSVVVTASFSLAPVTSPPPPTTPTTYTLTVAKSGPGTVVSTTTGINCGSDCSEAYVSGATVTLSATGNNNGTTFTGWTGACSGTSTTCTVTMNGAKTVSATFKNGKGK
jgi:hypothetical protein